MVAEINLPIWAVPGVFPVFLVVYLVVSDYRARRRRRRRRERLRALRRLS